MFPPPDSQLAAELQPIAQVIRRNSLRSGALAMRIVQELPTSDEITFEACLLFAGDLDPEQTAALLERAAARRLGARQSPSAWDSVAEGFVRCLNNYVARSREPAAWN